MSTTSVNDRSIRNDAFFSYSHAADGALAPAFRKALQTFARPWYRVRSLRIYCDKTGLMVTPELWSEITRQLSRSDHFVLLASPAAAQSAWVKLELQTWLETLDAQARLFIVLTEGDIAWNTQTRDFDWARTTALPTSLAGVFDSEPKFEDVRSLRQARDLSTGNPVLERAVASIGARIRGIPLEDAISENLSAHRGRRQLFAAATVAVVTAAACAGHSSCQQREQARLVRTEQQIHAAVAASSDAKLLAEGSRRSLSASLELAAGALRTLEQLGQPAVEAFGVMQKGLRLLPNPAVRRLVLPERGGAVRQLAAGGTLERTALRTDSRVCLVARGWTGQACLDAPNAPDATRPEGADPARFFWFADLEHFGLVTARAQLLSYDAAGDRFAEIGRFGAESMTEAKFLARNETFVQWDDARVCVARHRGAGRFYAPRCVPLRAVDEVWDVRPECASGSDCSIASSSENAVLVRRGTDTHGELCRHRMRVDAGSNELSLAGKSCQPSAGRIVGVSEDGSVWVESQKEGRVVVSYGAAPAHLVLDVPFVDQAEIDITDRWVVLRTKPSGSDRNEAYLLDLSTRLMTKTLQHDGRIAELMPLGRRPYILSRSGGSRRPDGTISLWNLSNGAETQRFILDGDVRAMTLTAGGRELLTAAEAEDKAGTALEAWSVTSELFQIPAISEPSLEPEVYVSAGHAELLVGERDRFCAFPIDSTESVWCAPVSRPTGIERARTLALDASRAYRTIEGDDRLCTWIGSGSPEPTCLQAPEGQRLLTLSKHGEYVVTREGAELCVWQSTMLGTGKPSCLEAAQDSIVRLVSDDGRKLAIESGGRGALYDLRTRAPEVDLGVVQPEWGRSVLSDDGSLLAIVIDTAAASRSTVRVFAVDSGDELASFDIQSRVLSVALAPRKALVALGTEQDGNVILKSWDTGPETIGTLSTGYPTQALAFDPTESELYTFAESRTKVYGELQRWLVDSRQMLEESARRLPVRRDTPARIPRSRAARRRAIGRDQAVGSL